MKNSIVVLTAFLISAMSYAQVQVSVSSGYAIGSAEMLLGESINSSETKNEYGSYGEGVSFQLRGTYFLNDSFGLDLGVGYLNGTDQTIKNVDLSHRQTDAVARARAFGGSLSVVYKFTNNIYGRFGALIKLGGMTEAVVYDKNYFAVDPSLDNPQGVTVSQAFGIEEGSYSETNYTEDYHGQFPLGFVGALGYKYDLDSNFSLFAEAEYYGISLKRKDSEITEFNTDIVLPDGTVAVKGVYSLDNLPEGYNRKTTYVDNLDHSNTDSSKKLSQKVPYSSFGINFGITYRFKGAAKKNNQ
ncbi:outer membrane protein with beta-barrel domain [Winogradskyella epiphytica]|uniref:Outer membrane protein with beta-barrel domain n=1 Tax=Winogradskyella epiphytica TaxID=262005 RepID=A0A2V4X9Z8_9FLAO|nr:outer membrane beta-barrel protein [Winogradskyella epiphytica]PYE82885.1 outer membrane protein with beta-barrel domain [Winogradskyella epiphytica]GGW54368.1 hypothetical protein GCM10008085_01870 [Winogradskyella epiphytica]